MLRQSVFTLIPSKWQHIFMQLLPAVAKDDDSCVSNHACDYKRAVGYFAIKMIISDELHEKCIISALSVSSDWILMTFYACAALWLKQLQMCLWLCVDRNTQNDIVWMGCILVKKRF